MENTCRFSVLCVVCHCSGVIAPFLKNDLWRMIARRLGVTDTEIDEIEYEYRKLAEQSYQSLRKWVDKHKGINNVDPNDLKQALLDYNLRRIAEDFFDIID